MVDSIPGVRNRIFLFYAHKNKRKMKKLLLLAFAASALAACSDDEYNYFELPASYTVAFEEARLGEDGYIWGKSQAVTLGEDDKEAAFFGVGSKYFFAPIYTEGDAAFQSLYTDYLGLYGMAYDSWNGFVISNHTDMSTAGFAMTKAFTHRAVPTARHSSLSFITASGPEGNTESLRFICRWGETPACGGSQYDLPLSLFQKRNESGGARRCERCYYRL